MAASPQKRRRGRPQGPSLPLHDRILDQLADKHLDNPTLKVNPALRELGVDASQTNKLARHYRRDKATRQSRAQHQRERAIESSRSISTTPLPNLNLALALKINAAVGLNFNANDTVQMLQQHIEKMTKWHAAIIPRWLGDDAQNHALSNTLNLTAKLQRLFGR